MNPTGLTQEQLSKLTLDREHFDAYFIASLCKSGRVHRLLEILAVHSPRKLRLVVDALQGKRTKSELTLTGTNIVQAWYAAAERCGRISYDDNYKTYDFRIPPPTVQGVKMEFAISIGEKPPDDRAEIPSWLEDLEGQKKIPADWTFRKTLARCELEVCKDKLGKPRKK